MSYRDYANPNGGYLDYANPSRDKAVVQGGTLPAVTVSQAYDVTHVYYRKDQDSPEIELLIPFRFGRRRLDRDSFAYFARYKTDVETGIEKGMWDASLGLLGAVPHPPAKIGVALLKQILPTLEPATDFPHGSREQTLRTMLGTFLGQSSLSTPYEPNPFVMPSDVMLSLSETKFDTQAEATAKITALFYLIDLKLYEWKVDVDLDNFNYITALLTSLTDKTPLLDKLLQSCMQMSVAFGTSAKPDYVGVRVTQLASRREVEHAKKAYPKVPTSTTW